MYVGISWQHLLLFKRPVYPEEEMDEENIIDDDAELTLNKVEDDVIETDEEEFEEEENILGLDDLKKLGQKQVSDELKLRTSAFVHSLCTVLHLLALILCKFLN